MADKETTRRTVLVQKESRIVPVDHLHDTRPGEAEEPHDCRTLARVLYYTVGIGRMLVTTIGRCSHMTGPATSPRRSATLR